MINTTSGSLKVVWSEEDANLESVRVIYQNGPDKDLDQER